MREDLRPRATQTLRSLRVAQYPLHCCAKAVNSSVYSTVFAAGEPLLHVCRSQSSSKPGFHFGLLASCKDTPTCLPSSHAGEFFPPERPQSLLRGLVRPLSCRPQAELPPFDFGSTDISPSPLLLLNRCPYCPRPGYPAGTGSAAICCTIAPNRRRVRCSSASNSQ